MPAVLRAVLAAFISACVLIVLLSTTAHAQSWNSSISTGLTSVESAFNEGTYTWTLKNKSSLPGDADPTFDILVWELTPYQVREPLYFAAPEGWDWTDDSWKVISTERRYYTPYALGPGKSIEFRYTPDPEGRMVNSGGPQPPGLAFVAHVAAVVPGSGSADGSARWTPASSPYSSTWHDRCRTSVMSLVPEPKGALATAVGACAMVLSLARRRDTPRL